MENYIKVIEYKSLEGVITLKYEVSDNLKKYFNLNNLFSVDYYEDISNVPESIGIIPFLSNILPIAWVTNSTVYVKELDKIFYESLPDIRNAFSELYDTKIFKGNIVVEKLCENKYSNKNLSVFCSGGVDSTNALITILKQNKRPYLITLWGSDVWDYNKEGWDSLKRNALECGSLFNLNNLFIKSNFRKFINENELNNLVLGEINDSWWHGIQHGWGLIGHIAPLAYKYKIGTHYMPGTIKKDEKKYACASTKETDESIKFGVTNIIHEGWEYSRLDKVRNILYFISEKKEYKNFQLRVCYMDKGNKLNCCNCEKCFRTILEILSLGYDPIKYGFTINKENYIKLIEHVTNIDKAITSEIHDNFYKEIYDEIKNNNVKLKYRKIKKIIIDRWGEKYEVRNSIF